jgi:hypothetical protein
VTGGNLRSSQYSGIGEEHAAFDASLQHWQGLGVRREHILAKPAIVFSAQSPVHADSKWEIPSDCATDRAALRSLHHHRHYRLDVETFLQAERLPEEFLIAVDEVMRRQHPNDSTTQSHYNATRGI